MGGRRWGLDVNNGRGLDLGFLFSICFRPVLVSFLLLPTADFPCPVCFRSGFFQIWRVRWWANKFRVWFFGWFALLTGIGRGGFSITSRYGREIGILAYFGVLFQYVFTPEACHGNRGLPWSLLHCFGLRIRCVLS